MGMILRPYLMKEYSHFFEGARASSVDKRIDCLLEHVEFERDFHNENLTDVLIKKRLSIPETEEWDDLNFPYTSLKTEDDDIAAKSFRKAVILYVRMPLVKDALSAATAAAGKDLNEDTWAEQQRLLGYAMQLWDELMAMMAA